MAGLLTYTPPPTELQASSAPAQGRDPAVAGPFTATPASVPMPAAQAAVTTTTVPVTVPTTSAPPVTDPPPPRRARTGREAPGAGYTPAPVYYPPPSRSPRPNPTTSGDTCAHFDNLLTLLDDGELRAAMATVC